MAKLSSVVFEERVDAACNGEAASSAQASGRARTVVIIDDMRSSAMLLKAYMEQIDGVSASTFSDPEEALLGCSEAAPDLVLVDYHMPKMNGVEFLQKFRNIPHLREVPLVMITGNEKKEALYEALEAGANDYLRKPVDAIEVITRARNLLELRARQIELAAANEQLYHLATTDQLTGLKNRRHFMEKLDSEVDRSSRYGRPCAVAILDVDLFKAVNDTYGHDVGDKVLQSLSQMLLDELRNVDLVGRIGGEEFALVLPETSKGQAWEVCQRLLARIRDARVTAAGVEVRFTASIGLAQVAMAGDQASAVLKRADEALYRAKHSGRDRCELET
jgi:diguanylate cyclase (GGDEF)-like protein